MSSAKRLAQEILDTRRLALGHATSPQLTSSSIDGGGIEFTGADGKPIAGIGIGDDGGFIIDYSGGPKPPKPSPPTVTADAGIFRIEWDGSFVNEGDDGVLATSDTDRVEIHASMDENFVPDRVESFGGAFATLDGGSFTLGPLPEAGTYYFRLVARSKSAQFSEPSERVEQTLAITSIDLEVIDAWLTGEAAQNTADGKNSIWRGPDEPVADPDRPFKDGDIWFEMVDGKSIPNIWDETAGAWVANDDYRQSEIERVQQELRQELDTIVVDGSGTKNFYKPVAPKATDDPAPKEGDLWFDTSEAGANTVHVWTDGSWVSLADARVQEIAQAQEGLTSDLADADQRIADAFGELDAIPGQISAAKQAAIDAAESDATAKAAAAQNAAQAHANLVAQGAEDDAIAAAEVKAQELADAAQDAAETAAQAKADAARDQAIDAATAAMGGIPRPSYGRDVPTHDAPDGSVYFQTDPKALATFEWAGSPHASESIKYVDGVEVARNLIPNPSLEGGITGWRTRSTRQSTVALSTFGPAIAVGTRAMYIQATDNASTDCVAVSNQIPVNPNSTYTFAASVRKSSGTGAISLRVYWYDSSGNRISLDNSAVYRHIPDTAQNDLVATRVSGQYPSPDGAVSAEVGFWLTGESDNTPAPGTIVHIDAATFVESAEDAPYFDGDTADSVINAEDKVTAQWERRDGAWVPVPIRSEAIANLDVGKLTAGSAEIAELVAQKIFAEAVVAKTATADEFIGTNAILTGAVTAAKMKTGTITAESGVIGSINAGTITVGQMSGARILAGTIDADTVLVESSIGSTLIKDGAILTEHIKVGAITAESGIIGSIDANVITVGKIMGNQLDADAINGKTITGATIRTASSGSRVELTHNGLKQYNSLGVTIVDMTQGHLSIAGDLHSGVGGGARVSIVDSMWDDIAAPGAGGMEAPGVSYPGAGAGIRVGVDGSEGLSIYHLPYAEGESSAVIESPGGLSGINMHSSGFTVMGGLDSEKIKSNGRVFTFKGGSSGGAAAMQSFNGSGQLRTAIGSNSTPGKAWMQALGSTGYEAAGVTVSSSGTARVSAAGQAVVVGDSTIVRGDNGVDIMGIAGNVTLTGQRVQSTSIYNTTGVTSASVYINSATGSLGRNTSSARYKQDIKAADPLERVLDVEPRYWRDRNSVAQYAEAQAYLEEIGEGPLPCSLSETPDEPGFEFGAIAEEVDGLGLFDLVVYDAFGRPDALHYEKFGVALIPIVRSLRDRIESLEAQLAP